MPFDLHSGLVAFSPSDPLQRKPVRPYCCFETIAIAYRLVYEPHLVAYGLPASNLGLLSALHTLRSALDLKGSSCEVLTVRRMDDATISVFLYYGIRLMA